MFRHDKQLLHDVRIDGPCSSYSAKILGIKNLLLDITNNILKEAHNTLFREAFNKIQDTGSLKDWGITKDSKLYFDLSTPGTNSFNLRNPNPPSFSSPNQ